MCDVQIQRIGVFKFLRDSCAIVHNRTNLLHENFDRWREKKLDSTCLKRIPYFIVLVSLVEVSLSYCYSTTPETYYNSNRWFAAIIIVHQSRTLVTCSEASEYFHKDYPAKHPPSYYRRHNRIIPCFIK